MIDKCYLKLSPETPFEPIFNLLSNLKIFSDIYVFADDPLELSPQIFKLAQGIRDFLSQYSFCRIYLHLVHPFRPDLNPFYTQLTEFTSAFNIEGYNHQCTPRFIIFPVLTHIPNEQEMLPFLNFLEDQFMPPSLIVDASHDASVPQMIERLFYLSDPDPIVSLGQHELLLDLTEMEYPDERLTSPCMVQAVIDERGYVYPCFRAYQTKTGGVKLTEGYIEDKLFPPTEMCAECKYRTLISAGPALEKRVQGEIHFELGLSYFDQAAIEAALKHFNQALALVSEEDKSEVYFYLALCKANLGEYQNAIELLQRANIWNYNAYFYLGICHFNLGNYKRAKDALIKALEFELPFEDKISIVLYLASAYKEIGEYSKAISLLKNLVLFSPEIKEIYNLMGTCYYKTHQYQDAIACFEKAIGLDPNSAIDYANLCLSFKAIGNKEKAILYCQKALQIDPTLSFARTAWEELNS